MEKACVWICGGFSSRFNVNKRIGLKRGEGESEIPMYGYYQRHFYTTNLIHNLMKEKVNYVVHTSPYTLMYLWWIVTKIGNICLS